MKKVVTIFGSGSAEEGSAEWETAYLAGRALAGAGVAIANGGYGGTMLASAKGAASAGGEVIAVTCSAFRSSRANPFVTTEIATSSLEERLARLIELGEAYLALPGATGTLLEVAMVWELKNKGFMARGKPIILLGGFWEPLLSLIGDRDAASLESLSRAAGITEALGIITGDYR